MGVDRIFVNISFDSPPLDLAPMWLMGSVECVIPKTMPIHY